MKSWSYKCKWTQKDHDFISYIHKYDGPLSCCLFFKFQVGNGVLDSYYDNVGLVEYWWDHALISDTTYNALLSNCDFHQANLSDLCNSLQDDAFNKDMGGIDPYSIYTPVCPATIQSKRLTARRSKGSNPVSLFLGRYFSFLSINMNHEYF